MNNDAEVEFAAYGDVAGLEAALEHQDRPGPARRARPARLLEVDQSEPVGVGESLHRALDAMTVRIRLDDRPNLAPGRARTSAAEVVPHCGEVNMGSYRAWHCAEDIGAAS